jgi:SAM-dependent methyltransferase
MYRDGRARRGLHRSKKGDMTKELYTSGEYLEKNPLWHADESPWKAKYVLQMMARNGIAPKTICDVGCGAGETLRLVHEAMKEKCVSYGYEISPMAFALCQSRANDGLHFKLADIRDEEGARFDLLLLMDVLEHLEDYFSFLREIRGKGVHKIIHIPLDISARTVLRGSLSEFRAAYGHLHYFTKDVAIQMLKDAGYEVIDYLYTWQSNSLEFVWNENKKNPRKLVRRLIGFAARQILAVPSRIFFAIHQDLAARVLGRWRLLVLAR